MNKPEPPPKRTIVEGSSAPLMLIGIGAVVAVILIFFLWGGKIGKTCDYDIYQGGVKVDTQRINGECKSFTANGLYYKVK